PGNVRELENLLERACALCEGDEIGPTDIDLQPACFAPAPAMSRPEAVSADVPPAAGMDPLEHDADDTEVERMRVLKALEDTRWNRSAAARNLGMTLRQLRYRLQKWGME
uniref:helix-turn-helix domain-containing protein n=1 Tax=Thauera sp. TaxID=1905334 RepID=UPI00257C1A58